MANININLGEVVDINIGFSRYSTTLSGAKRELEILKWKLDREIMQENNMSARYESILRQINQIEDMMADIHNCISSAVVQYEELERVQSSRVNHFE